MPGYSSQINLQLPQQPRLDFGQNPAAYGEFQIVYNSIRQLWVALTEFMDSGGSGIPDAPSDGNLYGRKNGTWEVVPAGAVPTWGTITGTLSAQTDLQAALDAKFDKAGGTVAGAMTVTGPLTASGGVIGNLTGNVTGNVSGNAGTATQLLFARMINGTAFDGTTNIVTSYWGSTRTITIGATGKAVNGSADVSWSLAEIGAASAPPASGTYVYSDGAWKVLTAGTNITIVTAPGTVTINSTGGGVTETRFPLVTGEVPPVLVYLDDGHLVWTP